MKDTAIAGSLAGIVASALVVAIEWGLGMAGLLQPVSGEYITILLLPRDLVLSAFVQSLVVAAGTLTGASFFGSILAYFLTLSGRDYRLWKGLWFSGVLFIVHVSVIPKLWEPNLLPLFSTGAIMTWQVVYQVIWAVVTVLLLNRLTERAS